STTPTPRHTGERPVRVEGNRDRERPRVRRRRVRELERDEREEGRRRRVPPPPPRPVEDRPRLLPAELEHPHRSVRKRTPRAQGAPDVAEQHRQEWDAEPEDDVHERRREVQELGGRPEERGRQRDEEEPDRDQLQDAPHRSREEEPAETLRNRATAGMRLEPRPLPEKAEEDERDDEDGRRGREEERLGNRQVADAADPVSQVDHGSTVRSAIWTPLPS